MMKSNSALKIYSPINVSNKINSLNNYLKFNK